MTDKEQISYSSIEAKQTIEKSEKLHDHTALLDQDSREFEILNYLENNFNDILKIARNKNIEIPTKLKESKFYKDLLKNQTSKYISKAVADSNVSVVKRITGKKIHETDISGLKTLRKMKNRLKEDVYIAYIMGKMGTGKTDFALLLAEIYKYDLNGSVGSNISSCTETKYISELDELKSWLESNSSHKLFIFDDASNFASGHAKSKAKVEKKFLDLLRNFRKNKADLIIIGHSGKDIHKEIRSHVVDFIKKHDGNKKKASFYSNIKNRELRKLQFTVNNIPETNFDFDTNEKAKWNWNIETDNKITRLKKVNEIVSKMKNEGIENYIEKYKSKDSYKLRLFKITKDFDVSINKAKEVREHLKDQDYNIS